MMVNISQKGNLYELRFPYNETLVLAMRELGATWDKSAGVWATADGDVARVVEHANAFGGDTDGFLRVCKEQMAKLGGAVEMDVNGKLAPEGAALKSFQQEGVEWIASRVGTLLADSMGLGKTNQAISALNAAPSFKRAIIVCPANLKYEWYKRMRGEDGKPGWLVTGHSVGIASGGYFPPTDIVIINYDIFDRHKPAIDAIKWDFAIVDECHYCKNVRAKRTKALIGGTSGRGQYKVTMPPLRASRRIALSGTPLVNKPSEVWAILHWLDPKHWPSLYWFEQRYCGVTRKVIGTYRGTDGKMKKRTVRDVSGMSNLAELNRRLRSTVMIRRLKKDVLKDLPPKLRQVVEFEVPNTSALMREERRLVADIEKRATSLRLAVELAKISGDVMEYRAAVDALSEYYKTEGEGHISQVRRDLAVAKVPYVVDHIRNACLDPEHKVVLFAHHRAVIEALHKQLNEAGVGAVKYYGGMTTEEKQASEAAFKKDRKCQVFIGGITAAGVGLTLTSAHHVVFAELDWVPGNMSQCEDRCHRIGQQDSVLVQHLVARSSLDASMAKRLVEKQEVLDAVLDDETPLGDDATPVDWIADHREAAAVSDAATELDDPISEYQCIVYHNGMKRLAANRAHYSVTELDHLVACKLASLPSLKGRAAAYAKQLAVKYLRERGENPVDLPKREW